MNLGLEYLIRSKLTSSFVNLPCSLFLKNEIANRKLVVTLDRKNGYYIFKHWHLNDCGTNQVLPKMEEFRSSQLINSSSVVSGYSILKYKEEKFPIKYNSWRFPMSKELYDDFHNHFINSRRHARAKEEWLWHVFLSTYIPDISFPRFEFTLFNYQKTIERLHPKKWKIWNLWRKHMLDFPGIPGEFIFMDAYDFNFFSELS